MNLVIPVGSVSKYFPIDEYYYPKPLIEIASRPMIQVALECLVSSVSFDKIVFVVRDDDCRKFHLDKTLELISPLKPVVIKLRGDTKGALCSVLMGVEHINSDRPLVISNADQVFTNDIGEKISSFFSGRYDAACLTFESVHPRWSYVRADAARIVSEVAEKRPISRHAIAGLYMYRRGSEFVKYAMNSIRHGAATDGAYFISPVFNEYILDGKFVEHYPVPNEIYHTFYNPQGVKDFEAIRKAAK